MGLSSELISSVREYGYVHLFCTGASTLRMVDGMRRRACLLFASTLLKRVLLLTQTSFHKPTKLQQDALPLLVKGHDVVVDAPANSGKTTTSCISALQKIDISNRQCQALILASTPQAALRIQKIVLAFGSYDIHCHACTNQADLREDRMRLKKGAQIVVGTPGCIHELIGQGTLTTKTLRVLILDRVDEMYNGKIKDIIEELLRSIPRSAQVVFLLSKMSKELKEWTTKFMHNPEFIDHDTEMPDLEDTETLVGSVRAEFLAGSVSAFEDKPYPVEV